MPDPFAHVLESDEPVEGDLVGFLCLSNLQAEGSTCEANCVNDFVFLEFKHIADLSALLLGEGLLHQRKLFVFFGNNFQGRPVDVDHGAIVKINFSVRGLPISIVETSLGLLVLVVSDPLQLF